MSEIKITALTQGINVPSARFRWRQHQDQINKSGFNIQELPANPLSYPPVNKFSRPSWLIKNVLDGTKRVRQANKADICFLQKPLCSTLYSAERLLKVPTVFDVDDAIHLNQRFTSVKKIAQKADIVLCGNSFLANYYEKYSDVTILPTSVNTSIFKNVNAIDNKRLVIGWSGTSSNFKYLYQIEGALNTVLSEVENSVIKIVSNAKPNFKIIPENRIIFERWTPENEVNSISDFNVGIMPIEDTLWGRGKCSFKMLTYMSMSQPVVVSPVGMNNDVLKMGNCGLAASNSDDWIQALQYILLNFDKAKEMGEEGRKIVENYFSSEVVGTKLINTLRTIV